ncbi:gustatory receptor 23a-like [Sitodiplosis mosellana]|uniref:gustatory receptor 23a-like n=1 Tax=Sitodiplosis mosellana TaxID=263140 RepID=UPI0024448455|nr:gustatory receptor 23a-like [Sitodiplosis mosellana]
MYSNTLMRLRPIQVLLFVYLLRTRLILINEELKTIHAAAIRKSNGISQTQSKRRHRNRPSEELSINCRLITLKHIYSALNESFELINEAVGWSMVAFTMQTFVEFTCNCYWGYVCLYEDDCLWSRLVEAILHRIPIDKENQGQNDMIREFALQVHHEEFLISAKGYFNINLRLMGSLLASSSTFLIILIQFEESYQNIQSILSNRTTEMIN